MHLMFYIIMLQNVNDQGNGAIHAL